MQCYSCCSAGERRQTEATCFAYEKIWFSFLSFFVLLVCFRFTSKKRVGFCSSVQVIRHAMNASLVAIVDLEL